MTVPHDKTCRGALPFILKRAKWLSLPDIDKKTLQKLFEASLQGLFLSSTSVNTGMFCFSKRKSPWSGGHIWLCQGEYVKWPFQNKWKRPTTWWYFLLGFLGKSIALWLSWELAWNAHNMGRESISMIFCFPKTESPIPPKTVHFHFWEAFLGKWSQAAERS